VTEALVGETVDTRYELKRLIARGGMGLVFEAHHKFTRRSVALKLLATEHREQKETRRRLLREAHALTTVRHPGFVEVLDAGVCAEHGPYVAMEMLEGRTLDGILASRRRLSIADAVQIGRTVCSAIAHAHAHGVIHRDIKPSNVFVARNEIGEETVKIIDLGVAAVAEEQLQHHDRKLTKVHEVLGTPEYMAPEQLWGQPVDVRTDVYSIGMSLYECLTGDVPYSGAYPEVLVQVSNAPAPPDVRAQRRDVPAALAIVIENALEKDKNARFPTASELGRALVAAAAGVDLAPSSLLTVSSEEEDPVVDFDDERARTIQLVRRKEEAVTPASGPHTSPAHRRQFVRAPYVTPVRVFSATGSEIHARSEEISEEGMLVVTPLSFPLGAPLRLHFASPGTGQMIQVSGSVRWLREARGRSAMGIEFVDVPPILRRVVSDYVAMLPAAQASRA
jgi:serine/threonine-protein kinase